MPVEPGCLVEDVAPPEQSAVGEQRPERAAVHHQAGLYVRGVDDRRREVDIGDSLAQMDAGRNARPANDQWHSSGRVVDVHLPERYPVLALEEAVVGREHDQGVVELAARVERRHDPLHGLVDGDERLDPAAVTLGDHADVGVAEQAPTADREWLVGDVRLVERGRHRQRRVRERVVVPRGGNGHEPLLCVRGPSRVRRHERHPEEERRGSRRSPANDVDRLARENVRLVGSGVAPVAHEPAVLVQAVVEVVVGRRVDGRVPLRPARRDLARIPEPVAVQVLAEVDRGIARALQPHGQGVRAVEPREAAVRRGVPENVVVVRVLAREEGRSGGAAERERDEAVVEGRAAVAEQAVHVRHEAHVVDRLVVGHQHDDVRPLRGSREGRWRAGRRRGERGGADEDRGGQGCGAAPHEPSPTVRSRRTRGWGASRARSRAGS